MAETIKDGDLVWVGIYEHRHGSDVWVLGTREQAEAQRQEVADTYWDEEMPDDAVRPDDREEMADAYFDEMCQRGETFIIVGTPIQL